MTSSDSFLHLQFSAAAGAPALSPKSSSFSVSVGPVVLFSVLDHFLRRPEQQTRVIGALLGVRSEDGSEVEIRNCFPLNHSETSDQQVVVDTDYLNQMYSLHQRVNSKETIVGWYATGTEINPNSVWIHEFFANETTPFQPVHLLVDTTLSNDKMACRSFVSSQVGVPGTEHPGSMFVQIPCEVKYFDAERSGLDLISMAKGTPDKTATILSDMDSLERSILHVQNMVETVTDYVDRVLSKKEKANNAIGRFLMDIVSLVPRIDAPEFEKMFNKHLNDLLMVVYLANLTRTQLAIAERLHKMM
ncbi:maintenance of mitochondrial structure and function-domain-containing protein [Gaertneriomyces semiglobifer]|nr:maintenance of mitochondrial structure and function-domain-containing protein [Gaertneriomyces semiglobifer]